MSSHLTFHCGLQKTGSTYLQQRVFPHISGGTYIGTASFRTTVEGLSSGDQPTLLSDENLSGRPVNRRYREQRRDQLSYLSQHWPGASLLLFLREPSSLVKSFYSQDILQGGTDDFESWLATTNLLDGLYFDELAAELQSQHWGKVLLIDQSQLRTDPVGTVTLIARFVGCSFSGWSHQSGRPSNAGVDRAGARLLMTANRALDSPRHPKGRVNHALSRAAAAIGVHPRALVQKGPLRHLNERGALLIPYARMEEIRESLAPSWARAQEVMLRSQQQVQSM